MAHSHSVFPKQHYAAALKSQIASFPRLVGLSTLLLVPPQQASPITTGLTSTPPLVQSRQQIERFALVLAVHSFIPTSLDSSGKQLFALPNSSSALSRGLEQFNGAFLHFLSIWRLTRHGRGPVGYTRRLSWDSLTARADLGLELHLIV
jgi:hypothetical protein